MSLTSADVPHQTVRKTIWTIVIVIGLLIAAMWAIVGVSLITSRQAALAGASKEGSNLMVAFREEIALVLRGAESEMNLSYDRSPSLTETPSALHANLVQSLREYATLVLRC